MIYIRGTKSCHLKLLMSYIYHGEVEVGREDLEDFLDTAGELKIKGLNTEKSTYTSIENKPGRNGNENNQGTNPCPDLKVPNENLETKVDEIHSQILVKQEVLNNTSFNEAIQDSNIYIFFIISILDK